MMDVTIIICTFLVFHIINGQLMHSTIVFSPSELITDKLSNNTHSEKAALRYGFHRTSECDSFEKAFLCIKKCVDKGYDIAYSDKYCFCTCYVSKHKAKYVPKYLSHGNKWKLEAPKTEKPAWIKQLEDSTLNMPLDSVTIFKKFVTETSKVGEINETKLESKHEISTSNSTGSPMSSDGNNETDSVTLTSPSIATINAKESVISNVTHVDASVNESYVNYATDTKTESGTVNFTDSVKGSESTNVTNTKVGSDTTTDIVEENNVTHTEDIKTESGNTNISNN